MSIEDTVKLIADKMNSKTFEISRAAFTDKINISVLRALNNSVLETQINGGEILYFSGKFIGEELIENHKKKIKDIDNILMLIKQLFKNLMIGILRNAKIKDDKITIDLEECAFCEKKNLGLNKENKCYFLSGLISGMIAQALGYSSAGKEISCRNMGNQACRFEIIVRK